MASGSLPTTTTEGVQQESAGRRQGHLPLSVGGVEGDPKGDESSESRYQVASSMRDLLLVTGGEGSCDS